MHRLLFVIHIYRGIMMDKGDHGKKSDKDELQIINRIVDDSRRGSIWGVRAALMSIPESERGALLNQHDELGDTALAAACSHGHVSMTEYLLGIPGVDPNIGAARTKFTPLILAAARGHKTIVEKLVHLSIIDTGLKDINQKNAEEEAIYYGHDDIARIIGSAKPS